MKNNVTFYGKVFVDDFYVEDTMRDTYKFRLVNNQISRCLYDTVWNWNRYSGHYSKPSLKKLSRFLEYEVVHKEVLNDFYATIEETAELDSLQIKSRIENVIRNVNGETEYFLDYIIRTEKDLESEKFAQAFFDDEMEKYEKNVKELESLYNKKDIKVKKWFEFWK